MNKHLETDTQWYLPKDVDTSKMEYQYVDLRGYDPNKIPKFERPFKMIYGSGEWLDE